MQEEDELAERSLPNDGNRPGGKRRYLPAAERKREILEAAVEEFSIGGFAATSLERIAILADPACLDVRGTLECGQDVEIDIGCLFEGHVTLGDGVRIGAHCVIANACIEAGARIHPRTR